MSSESPHPRSLKPLRRAGALSGRSVIPWAVAALLALGAAWLGARYVAIRWELALLRDQNALLEVALKSIEQQLEAERIITRRLLQDAPPPSTSENRDERNSGERDRESR